MALARLSPNVCSNGNQKNCKVCPSYLYGQPSSDTQSEYPSVVQQSAIVLHESPILGWSEEKQDMQPNVMTQICSGHQSCRCHPVVGPRVCRGMQVPCFGPTVLTDKVPANASRTAAPLQMRPKWADAVQTSLWICRPCVTHSDPFFLLVPDGAGQVASSWVPLRDERKERGAVSSFLPYSRQCPSPPQQSARAEHLLLPCPSGRVRSSGTGPVSSARSFQLHTLWGNWSTGEDQQGWERQKKILPLPLHPLFKDWILWQCFYVLPSTSHKAEKVLPATSCIVLLWFFQTLSGWHWYRQWEEDISVALGILAWDRRIPKGNREKWDNLAKLTRINEVILFPCPCVSRWTGFIKTILSVLCLWGEEGLACPDKLISFFFSYILLSRIVCLGTCRWEREDWAHKLSQALEPQQQLCCSGLGTADRQVPSESPQLSRDELYRETKNIH